MKILAVVFVVALAALGVLVGMGAADRLLQLDSLSHGNDGAWEPISGSAVNPWRWLVSVAHKSESGQRPHYASRPLSKYIQHSL